MRNNRSPETIRFYQQKIKNAGVNRSIEILPWVDFARGTVSYHWCRLLADHELLLDVKKVLANTNIRQIAFGVRLNAEDLGQEILLALNKAPYECSYDNEDIITVATHVMPNSQCAENVIRVIEQLDSVHPGGYINISGIDLRLTLACDIAVELYRSREYFTIELVMYFRISRCNVGNSLSIFQLILNHPALKRLPVSQGTKMTIRLFTIAVDALAYAAAVIRAHLVWRKHN